MSAVTIPGALADYLSDQFISDDETRDVFDAARRGRGRTLIIEPTSTRVLHVISRFAEAVLDMKRNRAQRDAARLWIKRAGHAPAVMVHRFDSTEEAYNATLCRDDIRDGDVLVVEHEGVVGFLRCAWPAAITAEHGELHTVEGDPRTLDDGRYVASIEAAEKIAGEHGFALLAKETEAAAGTWRGAWIGEQPADDALFVVEQPVEQGALFDDRATASAAACDGEPPVLTADRPALTRGQALYPPTGAPPMDADEQPQSFEEQQAEALRALRDRGFEARPASDPQETRAALDALLDGRPQLTSLAFHLVQAVIGSGIVPAPEPRAMSSVALTRAIAQSRRAKEHTERTAMIEAEFPVELRPVAQALAKLAETRKDGEQAVELTPGMIRRAKAEGMKPADIARMLKVTDSHVYAVLRKPPGEDATHVENFLALITGGAAREEEAVYEARRARVPAGHTLYNWRLELHDGPDGDGWQPHGEGDHAAVLGSEANFALALLAAAEEDDEEVNRHRARVLIWEGPDGTEHDALYVHVREPGSVAEPEFPVDEYKPSRRSDGQQ